jgi:hypothetical protein
MSQAAKSSALGVFLVFVACVAVVGCHCGRYYDENVGDYMVYPEMSGDRMGCVGRAGDGSGTAGIHGGYLEIEEKLRLRRDCEPQQQGSVADEEGVNAPKSPPSMRTKPNEPGTPASAVPPDKDNKIGDIQRSIGAKMRQFDSPEGKKTFRLGDDGTWRDDSSDPASKDAITVKYISDEYYNLLKAKPEVGDYVNLGEKIMVKIAGKTYIIEGIKK